MTNLKAVEEHMHKSIEAMQKSLSTIRTGKASPSMLESIRVDYYGTPTPINQVASVATPEARLLEIKPWDKNVLGEIEKAIQKSDLGLNPVNDGKMIRLQIPQPTEERRKDLVKVAKKTAEDCRVAVRAIRRDTNEEVEGEQKNKTLSDDQVKVLKELIQKLTDRVIADVEKILAHKEKEILEV